MIDEEKVRLMTRISIFDKHEKYHGIRMSRYFQKDYVKYNCLMTVLSSTVCFIAVVAAYVLIEFQKILADISNNDYFDIIKKLLLWYVIFVAVFFFFGFIVYNIRFFLVKDKVLRYNEDLNLLSDYMEEDEYLAYKGEVSYEEEDIPEDDYIDEPGRSHMDRPGDGRFGNTEDDRRRDRRNDYRGER